MIRGRQAIVGELLAQPVRLAGLHDLLRQVRDLPRILGRLQNRLRTPRELGGVRDTLTQLPAIREGVAAIAAGPAPAAELTGSPPSALQDLLPRIADRPELRDLLGRALADELPADLQEAGYIRAGYDAEVDRLRGLTRDSKTWLSDLERREQERTGIKSLKVRFNSVFGYYLEVTKANLHLVPPDYIRRQTTVGGERYVTEELKQKEKEILHAEEKVVARELELFNDLVAAVVAEAAPLQQTGRSPGRARCSRRLGGTRPRMGLLPPRTGRERRARNRRGPPPGGGADAQGAGRLARPAAARPSCPTTPPSPATGRRSSSSPGPTWPANPPTSGRWR